MSTPTRPMTLDQRLGIVLGVVLAIGITSITAFAYREMRSAALDAARQRLSRVALEIARLLETSAQARIAVLRRGSANPAVVSYLQTRAGAPQVNALLTSMVLEPSATVELWDAAGARVLQAGAKREPVEDSIGARFRTLVSVEAPGAISPLMSYRDSLRYAVLAGVVSEGRFLGYLVHRQPVAGTNAARDQLAALVGERAGIFVGNADGSLWTDFTARAEPPPIPVTGDSTLLAYTRPGTTGQLASARPVKGIPWMVLVEFPRDEVMGRTQAFLRDAGLVSALLIGLVGLGGWRSTRRVTRPIEGALVSSEARFQAIVEGTPNGVVMVDTAGTIVLVNAAIERVFGYTREELVGQPVERLVPMRSRHQHPLQRRAYLAQDEGRVMGVGRDLFGLRKDGSEIAVEIGLNPIERGGERFIVASVVDISARKEAELELRRSNEELQRFAYVASHDLQEPLRTVASYVQLLERRYADKLDSDAKEFIAFAVDGARRMQRLVEDLLMLSHVGSRGLDLVPTSGDAVLDAVVVDLEHRIVESGATITRTPLPTIRGDLRQLQQLLSNLIGNAIKFRGDSPPRIEVGANRQGNHWVFTVRDHGIGIAPQYYERIFVIFQRLHGRDEYPGTGIGLAICKKIVERHGGRIWVESEPGDGATFFFTLPATQET